MQSLHVVWRVSQRAAPTTCYFSLERRGAGQVTHVQVGHWATGGAGEQIERGLTDDG